jgi:hypothetical protein
MAGQHQQQRAYSRLMQQLVVATADAALQSAIGADRMRHS